MSSLQVSDNDFFGLIIIINCLILQNVKTYQLFLLLRILPETLHYHTNCDECPAAVGNLVDEDTELKKRNLFRTFRVFGFVDLGINTTFVVVNRTYCVYNAAVKFD